MDFWGNIDESELYKYNPSTYTPYGSYQQGSAYNQVAYQQGPEYKSIYGQLPVMDTAKQMLSGQLSPEEQKLLGKQFSGGLAEIRQGGYGMPTGAQAGLEMSSLADIINQSQVMAQNRRMQALPFIQQMAQENQYGYGAGQQERQFGYNAGQGERQFAYTGAQNERQYAYGTGLQDYQYGQGYNQTEKGREAQYKAQAMQTSAQSGFSFGDIVGGVASAGTQYGLNKLFPYGGGQSNVYQPTEMEKYYNRSTYK